MSHVAGGCCQYWGPHVVTDQSHGATKKELTPLRHSGSGLAWPGWPYVVSRPQITGTGTRGETGEEVRTPGPVSHGRQQRGDNNLMHKGGNDPGDIMRPLKFQHHINTG